MSGKDNKQALYERLKKRHEISPFTPGKDWPANKWLIEGVFLSGAKINFVTGQPKCGKSRLMTWMIAHMIAGRDMQGLEVAQVQKLIWLLGEEPQRDVQWRLERYGQLMGENPKAWKSTVIFMEATGLGMEQSSVLKELDAMIDIERPQLVVGDPWRRLHNSSENSNDEFARIGNHIRRWSKQYWLDWLLVHHTGKLTDHWNIDNIVDWFRGASDLPSLVDSAFYLDRATPTTNAGAKCMLYRAGRHAPDAAPVEVVDFGRSNPNDEIRTDGGWKIEGELK